MGPTHGRSEDTKILPTSFYLAKCILPPLFKVCQAGNNLSTHLNACCVWMALETQTKDKEQASLLVPLPFHKSKSGSCHNQGLPIHDHRLLSFELLLSTLAAGKFLDAQAACFTRSLFLFTQKNADMAKNEQVLKQN